ncbi:olfactomedin-like protein 2B isoform X3 [Engystomops pustulosus]|uniref:olfactomedin-like protein 2B isoform X3 n=1 Tax=Engystomops pustulosus TaxID=76066 RepID=UPI003AFA1DB2
MDTQRIVLLLLYFIHLCMVSITFGERSKNLSPPPVQPTESHSSSEEKTLEDESENQENILSQLLGDYDKVKAISEGSNCKCKCVVKPLNRDSCERSRNGHSQPEAFYTVETITSGPDCKCACVAPPSALNPCEGDFRLKKLIETDKNGLKLSTIIEMLEGAFYGLDLMKLHTVTTKIVGRVEKLEEVISKNITKEQEKIKDSVDEILTEINKKDKENTTVNENLSKLGQILQRDAAAAFTSTHDKYEERFLRNEQPKPHPAPPPQQVQRSALSQRQIHVRAKPAPKPVIQGVTFYKAKVSEDDIHLDDQQDDSYSGDNTIDMLIEDQLLKHEFQHASTAENLSPTKESLTSNYIKETTKDSDFSNLDISKSSENLADTITSSRMIEEISYLPEITTELTKTRQSTTTEVETTVLTTQVKDKLVVLQTPQPTIFNSDLTVTATPISSDASSTASKTTKRTKLSTDSAEKEAEDDLQKVIGRWSNSYKLPYSWIGTGHVVYNGSFYYNRAFTRNIIKYDMKHRYVAAWSMLHDVVFEEATPWRWKGHSDIDFAVDENGLWIIYPAVDDEGFLQEVIVLSKLNAQDLTTQKETTFRTGLRKDFFGNCFVICGVLYAVDNYNKKNANISYAFDTHTNTQIVPRLLFENEYAYTTQIDYNPKDRLLYAWDNGHQVTYQVIFAY